MKKAFTITLCLAAMFMMSFVITNDEPRRFKNLKVLPKNTTKEQLDSVMHDFAASLGQKCGFCHVFNAEQKTMDFVSDAKQAKEIAREMWKMTVKLNKKFFDIKNSKDLDAKRQVTCFTCHRGSERPETKAPMMKMGPPPGPGAHPQGPPPPGEPAPPVPTPGTDSTKHQ